MPEENNIDIEKKKELIKNSRMGKLLLDKGLVNEEQLLEAFDSSGVKSLAHRLVELKMVSEEDIYKAIAEKMNLEYIDLNENEIDPNAATIISEEIARKYNLIPVKFEDETMIVAMADPANVLAIDDLRVMTGYDIKPVVSSSSIIDHAIDEYCGMDQTVEQMVEGLDEFEVSEALEEEEAESENAPVVKLVNLIISESVRTRANDVHIEPQEKDVRIRFRIDGVLHEVMRSPKKVQNGVISRIKILSKLDIAEKRLPQDGRFGLVIDGKAIDFRVATLPTIHGEKIVLRLLEKESILISLEDLGLEQDSLEIFSKSFNKPYGAIMVTGPTGCGKTTTLYAVLNVINSIEKNIITVEDPVEYRLAGCNQVQVSEKAGMTFAAGLRSILRNDPDIVMIGEIRDKETAQISIESALTGHLVLSTLHTNDSASTLTRLTEMGIEPFLTASAVDSVLAQRLARRLCPECKKEYNPEKDIIEKYNLPKKKGKPPTLFKAEGCRACNDTGYKGRLGLFELLLVSEEIEKLCVDRATGDDISNQAIKEGMRTLREDGILKALKGHTSIEEILRVTV